MRGASLFITASLLLMVPSVPQVAAQGNASRSAAGQAASRTPLHPWWPRYKRPKTILLAVRPASQEEYLTLMTLSGLAARAANKGLTDEMIWVKQQSPNAYDLWFPEMLKQTGAVARGPFTTSELLRRFAKAGIVKGYLLYHPDDSRRDLHQGTPFDTSANVATSLCAPMDGVAIADTLLPMFQSLGLKQLFDARGVSEAACFERYKNVFNRNIVAMQDPKVPEARDAAVAAQAFLLCMPDALYEKVLAWANPGSPVLGWGIGDEFGITSRATRHGLFMTDTDWCTNLPLLSTEALAPAPDKPDQAPARTRRRSAAPNRPLALRQSKIQNPKSKMTLAARLRNPHPRSLWDLKWEDGVHYATFLMSDGDNVQWNMGDFTQSAEHSWWDSRFRGTVPMGWTCCYDNLVQVSPYTAAHLFKTASANDDFVLFGGGYFYPDLYGASRPNSDILARHADDVGAYMRLGGLKLLMFNLQQWDSPAGINAYATFANAVPDLLGIFAISYAPYTAGRGNTFWVPGGADGRTPIVSLRYALWNHASDPSQGDPVKIAGLLNEMDHTGRIDSDRYFSTVMVHAWSWFRAPHDGQPAAEIDQSKGGTPGTGRGVCVARWCADLLAPHVRVLSASDFILMMRLRLHPKDTLSPQLAALAVKLTAAQKADAGRPRKKAQLAQALTELAAARQCLRAGSFHEAFEHGRRSHALLLEAAAKQ